MAWSENMAEAEKMMRGAVRDLMLDQALPFLFDEAHAHTRRRYIKRDTDWEAAALIESPADPNRKLLRILSVETARSSVTSGEWRITFALKVGMGFEDLRADGSNSYDDLMAIVSNVQQSIMFGNNNLGLDDAITVLAVGHLGTRLVPQDKEGNPSHVADMSLDATVEVC